MSMKWRWVAVVTLGACGSDGGAGPDATPQPPTVQTSIAAVGNWMDDFIWNAGSWVPCTGCEHVIAYEPSDTETLVHVFERTPGEPDTLVERCTGLQTIVETEIEGFDPRERTLAHFDQAADDNTCGWGNNAGDYVQQVVTRDADGAPTLIAAWVANGDPAGAFPGWDYDQQGVLASAMRPCATAPDVPCEPSCDPSAGACDLPEPD